MICIKLNTTEALAVKALDLLKEQGYLSLGVSYNPSCVVYWSDGTFSGEDEYEGKSLIAEETLIFDNLEEFIEAVKQN